MLRNGCTTTRSQLKRGARNTPVWRPHTAAISQAARVAHLPPSTSLGPLHGSRASFTPSATLLAGTANTGDHRSEEIGRQAYEGKHAVVVGAGPCGALTAMYLGRHGFTVDVYEQTEASRLERGAISVGNRTYSVTLMKRAQLAMEGAGMSVPKETYVEQDSIARYEGLKVKVMHAIKGRMTFNRGMLAGHLISEAQRLYPSHITFHFGTRLQDVSLERRLAVFSGAGELDKEAGRKEVQYDLLIGADGASSRVREALREQVPGFSYSQVKNSMEYRTFMVPPHVTITNVDPKCNTGSKGMCVMVDEKNSATLYTMTDLDGAMEGVLLLDEGEHAKLKTVEQYVGVFLKSFPIFTEDEARMMATQLIGNPTSTAGSNTRCSQLHGPSTILMGDAGHSMWPSLGQGTNAALEDLPVFNITLEQCNGDLTAVPQKFTEARHADVLAIVELTQRRLGDPSHAKRTKRWANIKLMAQILLSKALPKLVPPPALFFMADTLTSYSSILQSTDVYSRIGDAVAAALAILVGTLALWPWLTVVMPVAAGAGQLLG